MEAVSGLGRAFLYAGTRSLLVTHWPVETTSARELTTATFEGYGTAPTMSRAQALRQAALKLMAKDSPDKTFSYAHPMFWAPFVLIGD